jgi:hypothetical protein
VQCFVDIGMAIQFSQKFWEKLGNLLAVYFTVVSGLALIFLSSAIYVAYRGYKEFKALALGATGDNIQFVTDQNRTYRAS